MNTTLYRPNQKPKRLTGHNFTIPNSEEYAEVTTEVAALLGCRREVVDILATGLNYVAYSVFDSADEINPAAMAVLEELTLGALAFEQNDEGLRGNVLVVSAV